MNISYFQGIIIKRKIKVIALKKINECSHMGWLLVWATRKPQWLLHVEKMHVIFLPISLMYFSFLFYWHVFQASEFHWNLLGIWIAKFVWSNVDCLLLYKRKMLIPVGNYMFKVNNRNTRKKVWNMFKVNNKDTKMTPMAAFWCLYC